MFRLLATDVDDTILAPDGSLPASNLEALRELRRRGIVVVLSSGRPTVSLRQMAARIDEPDDNEYLISFNGARVTTVRSDTSVFERFLPQDAIRRIMVFARERGLFVQGYGPEKFIVEYHDQKADDYAASAQMSYDIVPDMVEALPGGSAKLLIIHQEELIDPHQKALEELALTPKSPVSVDDTAGQGTATRNSSGPAWVTSRSKRHYLEVVAPGVSKGEALRVLAHKLGIPIEETVAVGDSSNDCEMLQAAGLGLAVANAREGLKQVADVVLTRRADEGSIAEVLERFFAAGETAGRRV